jgi:hypothetical protein
LLSVWISSFIFSRNFGWFSINPVLVLLVTSEHTDIQELTRRWVLNFLWFYHNAVLQLATHTGLRSVKL